jgi:hypothetical protein
MPICSRRDEAMQHIKYFTAILERFIVWYANEFGSLAEPLTNSFEYTGFVCDWIHKELKEFYLPISLTKSVHDGKTGTS